MIHYEIFGDVPDMAYDYSHLFKTFESLDQSDKRYHFVQTLVGADGLTSDLTSGSVLPQIQGQLFDENGCLLASESLDPAALSKAFDDHNFEIKVLLKHNLFRVLSQCEATSNPYGILVGIRPVKLVHEWLIKGRDETFIRRILTEVYGVTPLKVDLMLRIAKVELPILLDQNESAISLYICIPFCKTRCLYCSFPANPVKQKGHLMDAYLEALMKEISATKADLSLRGMHVDCLYIGGGTPTALTDGQFETLLSHVSASFDIGLVKEFTVEAGRPDTFSERKLKAMVAAGVDRICVNPQTMCDQTLAAIGRDHDAAEVVAQFKALKAVSSAAVNMDLIAGLDRETTAEMAHTVDAVLALRPENITLHTLALKRASRLNEHIDAHELQQAKEVAAMVDLATQAFEAAGYVPYYMYRQKQMIGNLENIGYALPGYVGLYNVRIMEEKHSILALGAGAVSKIYFPLENRLERFSNSKGLEDYLNRVEEMIEKRNAWLTSRYDLPIMK